MNTDTLFSIPMDWNKADGVNSDIFTCEYCYTPDEKRRMNETIKTYETIAPCGKGINEIIVHLNKNYLLSPISDIAQIQEIQEKMIFWYISRGIKSKNLFDVRAFYLTKRANEKECKAQTIVILEPYTGYVEVMGNSDLQRELILFQGVSADDIRTKNHRFLHYILTREYFPIAQKGDE